MVGVVLAFVLRACAAGLDSECALTSRADRHITFERCRQPHNDRAGRRADNFAAMIGPIMYTYYPTPLMFHEFLRLEEFQMRNTLCHDVAIWKESV
jgi:hypothetical protein